MLDDSLTLTSQTLFTRSPQLNDLDLLADERLQGAKTACDDKLDS